MIKDREDLRKLDEEAGEGRAVLIFREKLWRACLSRRKARLRGKPRLT
jgi:hypothetical protein